MFKALAIPQSFSGAPAHKSLYRAKTHENRETMQWVALVLVALNMVILSFYLFGVNSFAAAGYEIQETQSKISKLREENRKLLVKTSEASSIVSIQNDPVSTSFVPVGSTKFLQVNKYTKK